MTRWSANISLLYTEFPFIERVARAREDGFEVVEFWWPRREDLDALVPAVASSGVRVSLINIESGNLATGERGFLNRPELRRDVLRSVRVAVDLANAIGCPRLNALVGLDTGGSRVEQLKATTDVLREAVSLTRPHGIGLLIEALNDHENPLYLLHSTDDAKALVDAVGDGVALQFDAYHMGRMGEDIVQHANQLGAEFGHVQLADSPGRHEPGTGSLPIRAFLVALDGSGYTGHVGLEYVPLTTTRESLRVLRDLGFVVAAPTSGPIGQ